jgi:hypothetical protein
MHRSGTSLVTRVLEKMGVFMGWRKDGNDEAVLFQRLNDWVLMQAGASWDFPEPFHVFLRDTDLRPLAADYLRFICRSPHIISYLGPRRMLRHRGLAGLGNRWGWKDPRNTITLPLWLEVFPNARLIHVVRNGVDAARSLEVRRNRNMQGLVERHRRLRPLHGLQLKRTRFGESSRCASLDDAFELWCEYLLWAEESLAETDAPTLEVRYEDLLEAPEAHLQSLLAFTGVDEPATSLPDLLTGFVKGRRQAYLSDPELVEFAEAHRGDLARFGY